MIIIEKTILIVDDNEEILDIVSYHLKKKGYRVLIASHAQQALDFMQSHEISAAILDIMMPEMDGFSLCKRIRETDYFPILFLTAKVHEKDKLHGFDCGADDYMIKPFSSKELMARVDSLIRRNSQYNLKQNNSLIRLAHLTYDTDTGIFNLKGQALDLTDIEYRILALLIKQKGNSISTKHIYEHIWGDVFTISSNNNVVVHIKNIRKKMSIIDKEIEYIHTVWGKGYAAYV